MRTRIERVARRMEHDFLGDVRQVGNILEHAFVLCRGRRIELEHLPPELRPAGREAGRAGPETLEAVERRMIEAALERHGGNRRRAARELGIHPSTLYRKLKSWQAGKEGE